MSSKSQESVQTYMSPASVSKQGQGFGLVRLVSAFVGLGLMAWGFRRRRSRIGRGVGAFGTSLIVRSLGDGPLGRRVAAFIDTKTRLARLPEIPDSTSKLKTV